MSLLKTKEAAGARAKEWLRSQPNYAEYNGEILSCKTHYRSAVGSYWLVTLTSLESILIVYPNGKVEHQGMLN